VDQFIVSQNIQREIFVQSEDQSARGVSVDLDAAYFLDLSDDAVPALVKAYQTPSLPDSIREKLAASLACINYERKQANTDLPWQSFHFARMNADKALVSVKNDLKGFKITDTDWPVTVTTPSGEEFSCSSYYYD
jgi:hypothetical protein